MEAGREALEYEMDLKDSEAYHRLTGSKYLLGSSSAFYCTIRYPTQMVVMDARTQQVLVDQLFSVPKCARLARMSERKCDLLTKIIRAVPKRSEGELQDVVGEEFMRLNKGNVSKFERQKASGVLPTNNPHHRRNGRCTQDYYGKGTVAGSLRVSDPKEHTNDPWGVSLPVPGADVVVPQTRESGVSVGCGRIVFQGVARSESQVSIVMVSAMLSVRWLEANPGTSEQETAVPTTEQRAT